MKPPYDPAHVEQITSARKPTGDQDLSSVVAHCSCGFRGPDHRLGVPGVARALADDLNAHRATYAVAA